MHPRRLKTVSSASIKAGSYVLYWMQRSQRVTDNFALEHAATEANRIGLPLRVLFVLTGEFKDANERHYAFLLEGLKSLNASLRELGAEFVIEVGGFADVLPRHLGEAACLIMDKPYLRELRASRQTVAQAARREGLHAVEVESDLIVPIEAVSDKVEYAARTLRPKLLKALDSYLEEATIPQLKVRRTNEPTIIDEYIETQMEQLDVDTSVKKSIYFHGGEREGLKRLETFIDEGLPRYHESNDPSKHLTSRLSPYLHFGHLSPLTIHRRVEERAALDGVPLKASEAFLEQLFVRRELAHNFVYYQAGYDTFESMTVHWAHQTLREHADDAREHLYTLEELEAADTHDPYFNAAMREMVHTGYMHNYMRMYWGKMIIHWSPSPQAAYETILHLNNKYFLDGRDPNSYAGVAWCFGRHDQPFKERPVIGKLRPLSAAGLRRKFDIDRYIAYSKKL